MQWQQWRARLTYLAMSMVVTWHTFALVIAPTPGSSEMVQSFRWLLQPYLSLFRLDNAWNFFAPSVGRHSQFRYVVEDVDAVQHSFIPAEQWSWSLPRYVMWREFKYLYEGIMEAPEVFGEAVVATLCRKHASLKPASVTLLRVQEKDFWPEDYLRGGRPLDAEFAVVNYLTHGKCPESPTAAGPLGRLSVERPREERNLRTMTRNQSSQRPPNDNVDRRLWAASLSP